MNPQSDIIRTLINQNCTDESVMSMALSPNCTPPKLLEKLTEAERFDLALDVSMKLGIDVTPLWRIWGMRCLKSANYLIAREKFRHSFIRLKSPGSKVSPAQSRLLREILNELSAQDETPIPIMEEIELIKSRKNVDDEPALKPNPSVINKPKIYAECLFYLTEYGGVEDLVRFNVEHDLWDEAIKVLLREAKLVNKEKFFLNEVFIPLITAGRLGQFLDSLNKYDPDIVLSFDYLRTIYNFCKRNRRYHTLYHIQISINDLVAAANTQIEHFFLKKPMKDYKELNHRISSLITARSNLQEYLERLGSGPKSHSRLLTQMPRESVKKRLMLIDFQLEITRNFSLNEVSGCSSICDPNSHRTSNLDMTGESPVTLFEEDETRRIFLVALVLIYFDLSCSAYFSKSGLDLANRLIDTYGIDKIKVFKTAMRNLIDDEACDLLMSAKLLLERIKEDYMTNPRKFRDKVFHKPQERPKSTSSLSIGSDDSRTSPASNHFEASNQNSNRLSSLSVSSTSISSQPKPPRPAHEVIQSICDEVIRDSIDYCREADYKMELAKLLSDEAKIELYIEHGKLSNAQILACNMNRPDYVSTIIEEADKLNQNHVKTVCQLWLARHETRASPR